MKTETKYSYQKRMSELQTENKRLSDALYEFRMASSEIYDGIIEMTMKGDTSISTGWLLKVLKRAWGRYR